MILRCQTLNRSSSNLQIILKLYNFKFLLKRLFLKKKILIYLMQFVILYSFFPRKKSKVQILIIFQVAGRVLV